MSAIESINHYLAIWGRGHQCALSLQQGVCAIVDSNKREMAVIEFPEGSDCVLFHCLLDNLTGAVAENHFRMMLALNFEMNAMRGCWLALDADDGLRLCTQIAIARLDESLFGRTLDGFIIQTQEVSEFIREIRSVD